MGISPPGGGAPQVQTLLGSINEILGALHGCKWKMGGWTLSPAAGLKVNSLAKRILAVFQRMAYPL